MHHPRDRDLHDRPVPGLGGLAILAAVVVAALVFLPLERGDARHRGRRARHRVRRRRRRLAAEWPSPGGQARGAVRCRRDPGVGRRVCVENLHAAVLRPDRPRATGGRALTLVGIVAVMNVVNFTDGADGLAAGVCTIAAATFAIIALSLDRDDAGVLAALTAGASVGFLLAQLPSGVDLHGRRRARTCSGCCWPAWRSRAS